MTAGPIRCRRPRSVPDRGLAARPGGAGPDPDVPARGALDRLLRRGLEAERGQGPRRRHQRRLRACPDDGGALGASRRTTWSAPRSPGSTASTPATASIRQFVAMPLGARLRRRGWLTARPSAAGSRSSAFEPKPGVFPDAPPPRRRPAALRGTAAAAAAPSMALGAGGRIGQKLYPDPHGRDVWDVDQYGRARVTLRRRPPLRRAHRHPAAAHADRRRDLCGRGPALVRALRRRTRARSSPDRRPPPRTVREPRPGTRRADEHGAAVDRRPEHQVASAIVTKPTDGTTRGNQEQDMRPPHHGASEGGIEHGRRQQDSASTGSCRAS